MQFLVTFVYLYKSKSVIHQNAGTPINEEGEPDYPSGPAASTPLHQALHPVPGFRPHGAGQAIADMLVLSVYEELGVRGEPAFQRYQHPADVE